MNVFPFALIKTVQSFLHPKRKKIKRISLLPAAPEEWQLPL